MRIIQVASAFVAARLSRDRVNSGDNYGAFIFDAETAEYLVQRNMPVFD